MASSSYRSPGGTILAQATRRTSRSLGETIATAVFVVLMILNIALPKGGVRVGDFPLTWGYVAIVLSAVPAGLLVLTRRGLLLVPLLQFALLFLPIVVLVYFKAQMHDLPLNGYAQYLVLLGIFPFLILVCLGPFLEDISASNIAAALRWTIRFAVAWGILNFFLYLLAQQFVEIPYVTVNGAEVGETLGKNNMRGAVMKLVSSYNNGNIFGVCMVMLMPLYFFVENKKFWLAAFVVAILCSLSRTAWFGMLLAFMLMIVCGQIRVTRVYIWLGVAGAICVFLLLLPLLNWTAANVFESDLGGRLDYINQLEFTIFGADAIRVPETVYAGFLQSFGILGFVPAFLALAIGPIIGLVKWASLSRLRRAATLGALAYLGCALIDGAFVFPPTFVLFLFVTTIIYRRGYLVNAQGAPKAVNRTGRPAMQVQSVQTL